MNARFWAGLVVTIFAAMWIANVGRFSSRFLHVVYLSGRRPARMAETSYVSLMRFGVGSIWLALGIVLLVVGAFNH